MTVNASKTKIIIFYRGKIRNKPLLKIGIESIDVMDEYIYLGTTFSCNGCNVMMIYASMALIRSCYAGDYFRRDRSSQHPVK